MGAVHGPRAPSRCRSFGFSTGRRAGESDPREIGSRWREVTGPGEAMLTTLVPRLLRPSTAVSQPLPMPQGFSVWASELRQHRAGIPSSRGNNHP